MSRKDKLLEELRRKPKVMRAADLMRLLEAFGYELDRIHGSHHIFKKKDRTPLTVPMKNDQSTVKACYLEKILEQIEEIIEEVGIPWKI